MIPSGFEPRPFALDAFASANGPIYVRQNDANASIGLLVDARHCDDRGLCSKGVMAILIDLGLVLGATSRMRAAGLVMTVSLSCTFLRPARLGEWVQGDIVEFAGAGGIAQGVLALHANGERISFAKAMMSYRL